MMTLDPWSHRPSEEAYLFNPAFLGSLMFEFVKAFQRERSMGAPITFLPVALALTLHCESRSRLPSSTVSSLYQWVQDNEDLLVGFDKRIVGLMPYLKEALRFSLKQGSLNFSEGHHVVTGNTRAHFTASFKRDATQEVEQTIDKAKFISRWFLKSGSESSILSCWGVRP